MFMSGRLFMPGRHRRGYGLHVERMMLRLRRRRVKRVDPARGSLSLCMNCA